MKKRFIICINKSSETQEQKIIDYFKSIGVGYWHWLTNTWLVVDSTGKFNASDFRKKAREVFNDEFNLVIELNQYGDTWAGFGPNSKEQNMFQWINDYW